jgi:hypothetical protein
MLGMDDTKMCAPGGRPDSSVDIVDSKSNWKVEVGVIDPIVDVQTSLAPIRIVTYCACWRTALWAWVSVSATLAPGTE